MPAQRFFHGIMSKLYDERKDDPEAKDVGYSGMLESVYLEIYLFRNIMTFFNY